MSEYQRFELEGHENGGVDVFCLDCEEFVAGGGCTCCAGNEVTIADLIFGADQHVCTHRKETANA
ncbi:hypothetical protein H9W91_07115 [Streptomyces alfalfae]|uniref:hypothetical protein n=1 Tax=Streptomyces alfalfae TaxID=1642299 RepID=UPI001BA92DEE|nr:hypothetical protein [Streptomyces alfalfae]QUI30658.1 hypothetical protein H9W91_07115 [Streptomyces alfalfae]